MIIFKIGGYSQNGGYRAAHPLRPPEWVRMARIVPMRRRCLWGTLLTRSFIGENLILALLYAV
jgi:hypothetical protein